MRKKDEFGQKYSKRAGQKESVSKEIRFVAGDMTLVQV
jgi:hypothetical protein